MKHLERALDNQNQWWKYLIVFLAGFLGANAIGSIPLIAVIVIKIFQGGGKFTPNPENPELIMFELLQPDKDWNQLMMVVEKIEKEKAGIYLDKRSGNNFWTAQIYPDWTNDSFIDRTSQSFIEAVYNACVEYIKQKP